jgi:tetratricopeptide (TPR) repeat protein
MTSFIFKIFLFLFFLLPSMSWADFSDIETAILNQDYASVEQLAQEFLTQEKQPKEEAFRARYYLGLSYIRLGRFEEAQNLFKNLVLQKTDNKWRDQAYLGYFDSLYMDGRYEEALKMVKKLFSESPHSEFLSLAYLKAARANLKLTRWNDAADYLKKIVHRFPQSLEAYTAKQLLEEKQYFAVQVGAFLEQSRAQKLVEELNKKNEYAYVVETTDKDNRKFFRVRVGQMTKLEDAKELQSKLSHQGYPTQIYP